MNNTTQSREYLIALSAALLGIIVAIFLPPKDIYFFSNFMWYWLPQLGIIILLLILKASPSTIGGAAFVLALYPLAYYTWVMHHKDGEGLVWLGYLFSLPGGVLGSFVALAYLKYKIHKNYLVITGMSALFTFFGLLINQIIVCKTVMYCGF